MYSIFKYFLFPLISVCTSVSVLAGDNEENLANNQKNLQIGRYQIVPRKSDRLYLLDTATGRVWRSITKKNWVEADSWELIIADGPQD